MKYFNGEKIQKEDFCWHAERRRIAQVAFVVESEKIGEDYGVSETGVFLCENLSEPFPQLDLFIGEQFFEEEEITPLTKEERVIVLKIKKTVSEGASKNTPYSIQCIDNPLDIKPASDRKWIVQFYDSPNENEGKHLVCNDFGELKKLD